LSTKFVAPAASIGTRGFTQFIIEQYILHAVKSESKACPRTGHEGPEREQRYNPTLSLTSALDGSNKSRKRWASYVARMGAAENHAGI
jgi:hypothetical protein